MKRVVNANMKRAAKFLLFLIMLAWASTWIPLSKKKFQPNRVSVLQIQDRNGRVLREVTSDRSAPSRWVRMEEISPFVLWATLAAEDKRFYAHHGIDVRAIARAAVQNLLKRRVTSGASTISEQVLRNLHPVPRTIPWKLLEAWMALRLERMLSKNQILEQYLNRIPYGNGTYGIEAASLLYFGKRASRLSPAEAAFLAAVPQSPASLDPYRHFGRTRARQLYILNEMARMEKLSGADLEQAVQERIRLLPPRLAFQAPHFTDWILSEIPEDLRGKMALVRTTLDLDRQARVEKIVRAHLARLKKKNVTNAAVVVLDNRNGQVLALVGSADFFNPEIDGQVNGALSPRSPGSALKPFLYALAFERGFTTAAILPDLETHIRVPGGDFTPKNYDEKYHGPVTARAALANSYNVPAVRLQEKIGTAAFLSRLRALGFKSLSRDPGHYGVSLVLGDGEVSLLELTLAYRTLANLGQYQVEKKILEIRDPMGSVFPDPKTNLPARTVISPQAAYLITSILSDKEARVSAFGEGSPLELPFPCAAKTGTSKSFRDNWTIGFTPRYTVGVWVGNFNGAPMHRVSGITGAAPIFHDVMLDLEERKNSGSFRRPPGLVERDICPLSGQIPGRFCPDRKPEIFLEGTEPAQLCSTHQETGIVYPPEFRLWARTEGRSGPDDSRAPGNRAFARITFPAEGSIFRIDPVLPRLTQQIRFQAVVPHGIRKAAWVLDGKTVSTEIAPYWTLEPGRHALLFKTEDEKGLELTRPVTFFVAP